MNRLSLTFAFTLSFHVVFSQTGPYAALIKFCDSKGKKLPPTYNTQLQASLNLNCGELETISSIKKVDEYFLLSTECAQGATDWYNFKSVNFILLTGNQILSTKTARVTMGSKPKSSTSFVSNYFIKIASDYMEYDEDDSSRVIKKGLVHETHFITLYGNQLLSISDLTPEQRRIQRNLIFALKGLKFKSPDLTTYFSKFKWYKPQFDNVDKLITLEEKEFINLILDLEKKKGGQ